MNNTPYSVHNIHILILYILSISQFAYTARLEFSLNYPILSLICIVGCLSILSYSWQTIFQITLLSICIFVGALLQSAIVNGELINFIFWILLTPLASYICTKIDKEELIKIFLISTKFGLTLMTLDTILRFYMPMPPEETMQFISQSTDNVDFYRFKFGGFMFSESNSLGLMALAVYFSLRITSKLKNLYILRAIAASLVLLSFSRAAFIGLLLFEVLWMSPIRKKSINFGLYLIYCLLLNLLLLSIESLNLDGSLGTKNQFLNAFIDWLFSSDWIIKIFGIGIGRTEEYFGVYLHNFFILIFAQLGIAGGLMVLWILYRLLSGSYKTPVLFVYSAIGLSYLFMLAAPFLFIPVIIASAIRVNEERSISHSPF